MIGNVVACRVLIVDDNLSLAENIAEFLEAAGYVTDVAASAEQALPLARSADVTAVVTDFRLPGMTGAELLQRLRGERPPFRAVIISAHNDSGTVGAARAAGAEFLAKPLDLPALERCIRQLA